jgi:hypothetical protein
MLLDENRGALHLKNAAPRFLSLPEKILKIFSKTEPLTILFCLYIKQLQNTKKEESEDEN